MISRAPLKSTEERPREVATPLFRCTKDRVVKSCEASPRMPLMRRYAQSVWESGGQGGLGQHSENRILIAPKLNTMSELL